MQWKDVGNWLKDNAGTGAAIVGTLLTGGGVPAAIAAGAALVSSATGTDDPGQALSVLQNNPESMAALRKLANENQADIRRHHESVLALELQNEQYEHEQTQKTIRAGDAAGHWIARAVRPFQATASLFACFAYIFTADIVEIWVVASLLTLPMAYSGLRTFDKKTILNMAIKK